MKTGKAITAGIVGALAVTVLTWMARSFMGMSVNIEMMLGTMFGAMPGAGTWVFGFFLHLGVGVIFALVYAWCFENLIHRAGAGTGTLFGLVHALISGLMLGVMPAIHALIPEQMPGPGMFMSNMGAIGVMAFFVMHLVYGAIIGGMYGAVLHPAAHDLPPRGNPRSTP